MAPFTKISTTTTEHAPVIVTTFVAIELVMIAPVNLLNTMALVSVVTSANGTVSFCETVASAHIARLVAISSTRFAVFVTTANFSHPSYFIDSQFPPSSTDTD